MWGVHCGMGGTWVRCACTLSGSLCASSSTCSAPRGCVIRHTALRVEVPAEVWVPLGPCVPLRSETCAALSVSLWRPSTCPRSRSGPPQCTQRWQRLLEAIPGAVSHQKLAMPITRLRSQRCRSLPPQQPLTHTRGRQSVRRNSMASGSRGSVREGSAAAAQRLGVIRVRSAAENFIGVDAATATHHLGVIRVGSGLRQHFQRLPSLWPNRSILGMRVEEKALERLQPVT